MEYIINHDVIRTNDQFDNFLVVSGGYIPIAIRNYNYAIEEMKSQLEEIVSELEKN